MQGEFPSLSNPSCFLPSPPFPRVTMGTSLHSLDHTSPSCSDICKAFGSLPPRGTGRRAFPYVGLPALFIHVCICVCAVLFCLVCFLLGLRLFILEAPGTTLQTWLRLQSVPPGKRALEFSPLGMDQNLRGGIPLSPV